MSYIIGSWREGMQKVAQTIDETFGESLTITPCLTRPNYPSTPYPEQAITIQGVFSWRSELALRANHGPRTVGAETPGLVETRKPIITFARNQLPWAINRADHVHRCCDGTGWEVTAVKPDGVSRIELSLVQLGVQEQ